MGLTIQVCSLKEDEAPRDVLLLASKKTDSCVVNSLWRGYIFRN